MGNSRTPSASCQSVYCEVRWWERWVTTGETGVMEPTAQNTVCVCPHACVGLSHRPLIGERNNSITEPS